MAELKSRPAALTTHPQMESQTLRRESVAHLRGWNSTAFRDCEIDEKNSRVIRRPDPCYKQHIFEPVVLARDNDKFTIRVTAQMVKELKNVMTSKMEDRTEGPSPKNLAGETIWPKPSFEQSPKRKARNRLLGDWHTAITEVLHEYWKFTVSLRKRDSGEQARAAVVVMGPSEHVFGTGCRTDGWNNRHGSTRGHVHAKGIAMTGPGSTPTELVYLHTATANMQKRKATEEHFAAA